MLRSDFHYDLPAGQIAQAPLEQRTASRLLIVDAAKNGYHDCHFTQLQGWLSPGDLLVLNDVQVIPARLYGVKPSGGKVQILIERVIGEHRALAHLRASGKIKPGLEIMLEADVTAEVMARQGGLFELGWSHPVAAFLDSYGHVPLPPYIERPDHDTDRTRYQTVYARAPGAVAAPTAGLHFDAPFLARLQRQGVELAYVTLKVGAGTFQPLRCANIEEHRLHPEWAELSAATCDAIQATRQRGNRVIAVGTTAVRTLESAALDGPVAPFAGETDLFIYPGFRFRVVDALLTNFHLPESSLLMMVCAFAGRDLVMRTYRHAVVADYRFYSYGDAMFIPHAMADAI